MDCAAPEAARGVRSRPSAGAPGAFFVCGVAVDDGCVGPPCRGEEVLSHNLTADGPPGDRLRELGGVVVPVPAHEEQNEVKVG